MGGSVGATKFMGNAVEVISVSMLGGGTADSPSLTYDSGAAFGFLSALLSTLESQTTSAEADPTLTLPSSITPEGESTGSDTVQARTESGASDLTSTHATSGVVERRLPRAPLTGEQLAAQVAALGLVLPVTTIPLTGDALEPTGEVEGEASPSPAGDITTILRDDAGQVGTGPTATVVSSSLLPDLTAALALPASPESSGPGQPPPARTEGDGESSPVPSVRAQSGTAVTTPQETASLSTEAVAKLFSEELATTLSTAEARAAAAQMRLAQTEGTALQAQADASTSQSATTPREAAAPQARPTQADLPGTTVQAASGAEAQAQTGAQDSSQSDSQDAARSSRQDLTQLVRERSAAGNGRAATRSPRPFSTAATEGVTSTEVAETTTSLPILTGDRSEPLRVHAAGAASSRDSLSLSLSDLDLTNQISAGALRARDLSRVTLQLHPRELGEVRIAVESRDGQLSAHFQASHAAVQTWLEANSGALRTQMAEAGLDLQSMTLSTSAEQQGQQQGTGQPAVYTEPRAEAPQASVAPVTIPGVQVGGGQRLLDLLA
jgi:flagellar hook-length control protein FliK